MAATRSTTGHIAQPKGWFERPVSHTTLVAVFVVYVIVAIILLFEFFYYFNPVPQPVPTLTTVNETAATVIIEVPHSITVQPLKSASILNITVIVFPSHSVANTTLILGGNLTQLYSVRQFKLVSSGSTADEWTAQVAVKHTGTVQTSNGALTVLTVYHNAVTPTESNLTMIQSTNVPIQIVMTDFPSYFYLFILSLGVILSRVAPMVPGMSKKDGGQSNQGDQSNQGQQGNQGTLREFVWVPFSVVISLLIFTAFRQQVNLTTDIATNFALAFGFGYAFDKALSSAPGK